MATREELREQFLMDIQRKQRYFAAVGEIEESVAREERLPLMPGETAMNADTRILKSFSPVFGREDLTEEQMDQIRQFQRDYLSGSEQRRRPHLDRCAEELDAIMFTNEPDETSVLENAAEDQKKIAMMCYAQNIIQDNPDYFEAHFDTDKKKHLFTAKQVYGASYSGYFGAILAGEGYELNSLIELPEAARAVAAMAPVMKNKAEVGYQYYQNAEAAAAGRQMKDTVSLHLSGNANSKKVFGILDQVRKGKQPDRGTMNAAGALIDQSLSIYLDRESEQRKLAERAGMSVYDTIMIDGRSASEVFAGLKAEGENHLAYENKMNAAILSAMVGGKNRVEVAELHFDEESKLKVHVASLQADVSTIQPTKKEEYGWFRRTFFDWGPFRCKTRQEKIDDLIARDPGKEERHAAIAEKLAPQVEEGLERDRAEKAAAKQAAERARIHEKATKVFGINRGTDLDDIFYGHIEKDVAKRGEIFKNLEGTNGLTTLGRASSRVSFAVLVMMAEGKTIEEIMADTPEAEQMRKEAGTKAFEMLGRKDRDEIMKMFYDSGETLMKETLPQIDLQSPDSILEGYQKIDMLESILKDHEQIQGKDTPFVHAIREKYGERLEEMDLARDKASRYARGVSQIAEYYASKEFTAEDRTAAGGKLSSAIMGRTTVELYRSEFEGKALGDVTADPVGMFMNTSTLQLEIGMAYDNEELVIRGRESLEGRGTHPVRMTMDGEIEICGKIKTPARVLQSEEPTAATRTLKMTQPVKKEIGKEAVQSVKTGGK